MRDEKKTKKQLIEELQNLRRQLADGCVSKDGPQRVFENLRDSDDCFRLAAEHSNEGVIITYKDRRLFFNKRYLELAGYKTPEELAGRPFLSTLHPDDQEKVHAIIRQRHAGESAPPLYECRFLRPDGSVIDVEISASLVTYMGQPASLGYIRDITDRKRVESDLRESRQRLAEFIQFLPDATLVIDHDGKVIAWNRTMEAMTGIRADEMLGKGDYEYAIPFLGSRRPILIDLVLRPQPVIEKEYRNIRRQDDKLIGESHMLNLRGSQVYLIGTAAPLYDTKGSIVGAIETITDITERVRAEEEKEKLQAQLFQALKMEAIGRLAGGIAHDFNNILAAILGFTEMAEYKTSDHPIFPYLEQIRKAAGRAKDLVKQILTFSRQQEQEKKPILVTPIVQEVMKLLRSSLPATIEICQIYANEEDIVIADPTQIHQVMMNLCMNAAHAMYGQTGVLGVTLSREEILTDQPGLHPDLKRGSYLKLAVSDTGHGIDSSIKDKIFDPFFTTKRAGQGTGLGLAVVYGIVANLDGAISYDSKQGEGTTFTIRLPLHLSGENIDIKTGVHIPVGTERILFVDDEESIVELGKDMLTSLGYDVTACLSSLEALDIFLANPGCFDLMITDMTMPGMTGVTLATEILTIRPEIPILLITGFSELIDEEMAIEIGIKELLMKPISMESLAQAVRRALGSHDPAP